MLSLNNSARNPSGAASGIHLMRRRPPHSLRIQCYRGTREHRVPWFGAGISGISGLSWGGFQNPIERGTFCKLNSIQWCQKIVFETIVVEKSSPETPSNGKGRSPGATRSQPPRYRVTGGGGRTGLRGCGDGSGDFPGAWGFWSPSGSHFLSCAESNVVVTFNLKLTVLENCFRNPQIFWGRPNLEPRTSPSSGQLFFFCLFFLKTL